MTIGGPRHRNSPPPGSKRVGDWKGMRVRSLSPMANGMGTLPAGTIYTVQGTTLGLSLISDPCPTCGGKQHITRVQSKDVEPAPAQAATSADISDERILQLSEQFKNDPIGFAHAVLAERAAPASTDWSQSEEAQRLKIIADEFRAAIPTEHGSVLAAMIEQGVTVLQSYIEYAVNPPAPKVGARKQEPRTPRQESSFIKNWTRAIEEGRAGSGTPGSHDGAPTDSSDPKA